MASTQPASGKTGRARNYIESLRGDLQDLQGPRALIAELIQNADDADGATCMRFEISSDALTVWNDAEFSQCDDIYAAECSLKERKEGRRCDFHSFRDVSGAAKRERLETTGAFGIGFTAVYQITDRPIVLSAGWRWEIDELQLEHERITWAVAEGTHGTTFRLPWARAASGMRTQLGQDPVTEELIGQVASDLLDTAAESLLFLRRVDRIEVVVHGATVVFDRSVDGAVTTISGSDGSARRWYVVSDTFSDVAQQLRKDAGDQVIPHGRSVKVEVAVRLDDPSAIGRYFVTLPTEEETSLPVSVNASFFPKRDRKRILVDETRRGEWNRAIAQCAAKLVASRLETLSQVAGDRWTIDLLSAADKAAKSANTSTGWDPTASWRPHLWAMLPTSRVVPTCSGARLTIGRALVWSDPPEFEAASTLEQLGIHLVHPDVRAGWFGLRSVGVGIQPLHLNHVINALALQHDRRPFLPGGLEAKFRAPLWALIDHLIDPSGQRPSAESLSALDRIALLPLQTGRHGSPSTSCRADPETVAMLGRAGLTPPLVTFDFCRDYPNLAARAPVAGADQMVTWFAAAFHANEIRPDFDRTEILDWIANCGPEVLRIERRRLGGLPVYPIGDGFGPLGADVVLPATGFEEPLRLASILRLEGRPNSVATLFNALGVPSLTLQHYCANLLHPDIVDGLGDKQLLDLLDFLRRHHSLLENDDQVKRNLCSLRLVPCADGRRRQGREVYFATVDALVVGVGPPRVRANVGSPGRARLLAWLGVSDHPRPADVVEHCRSLRQPPMNHREVAAAVLKHLSDVEQDGLKANYAALQGDPWLPIRERPGAAARPSDVYTNTRRSIFSSQASFVDLPPSTEQSCRRVLQWLGVQTDPSPELVVRHLLWCAEKRTPVKDALWTFLSNNLEAPELDRLKSRRCVLLGDGRYVEPSSCFWEKHPFGTHRHHLDDTFSRWKDLFRRLGVRDRPSLQDAVDVLSEVAVRHGGADTPVLSDDRDVIQRTWVFLNDCLRQADPTSADLSELATVECVLDRRGCLRRPSDVLFRDTSVVARHFDEESAMRLVDRPENISGALEAAGVRRLRDAVITEVVERRDGSGPSQFAALVAARRHLLVRALRKEIGDPAAALDWFSVVAEVSPLSELVVVDRVELDDTTLRTGAINRSALWMGEEKCFLVIEPVGRWPEVAKEFAFALAEADGGDPEMIAVLMKNVLAAKTAEEAAAELDGLGFADLDVPVLVSDVGQTASAYADDQSDDDVLDEHSPVERESRSSEQVAPAASSGQVPATPQPTFADSPAQGHLKQPPRQEAEPTVRPSAVANDKATISSGPERDLKSRSRLKSYVTPDPGASDESIEPNEARQRDEVERAAVDAVLDYEKRAGRTPHEMPANNPGYDIESTDRGGGRRLIEVKGTRGRWDDMGVGLTSREFEEARKRGANYWLYVVEVGEGKRREIHRIQNPAEQIDRYFFDDGWRAVAAPSEVTMAPLPTIPSQVEVLGSAPAVKLWDWRTGRPTGSWILVPVTAGLTGPMDGYFAIQLAGNALGRGTRGGVALAIATTDAEDKELVVVRLLDRLDPDTGSSICVRFWSREVSLDPAKSPLRLYSDGAVAPISLEDRNLVEVLGRVVHVMAHHG